MADPEDLYDEILADGPSPGTLVRLLLILKEEGQLKRVIREGIKALKVYPSDLHIRQLLAETCYEVGRVPQAEAELDKLLQQLDTFLPAYKLQAEIYRQQDRNTEAAWLLKRYLAHRPEDQDAVEILETLKDVEESTESEPPPPVEESSVEIEEPLEGKRRVATPTLGEVYFNQGLIHEAINVYEKVVLENPDDERSKQRLDELRSTLETGPAPEAKEVDRTRKNKQKLLTVLEAWRDSIRKEKPMTIREQWE
jgi:tetratricopeptide (TPR) repeat protein